METGSYALGAAGARTGRHGAAPRTARRPLCGPVRALQRRVEHWEFHQSTSDRKGFRTQRAHLDRYCAGLRLGIRGAHPRAQWR